MTLYPKRYRKTDQNILRAKRAKSALNLYSGGLYGKPAPITEENIADLVCDLQHLARQHQINWQDVQATAIVHFETEAQDQSGLR